MKTITATSLRQALSEYDYAWFGLRVLNALPRDGSKLEPSRRWDDNEVTGDELSGTSAIRVDDREGSIAQALKDIEPYPGKYVVLLGSDDEAGSGEDAGEILLKDPIVLERWRKGKRSRKR
jgi:hypothetical protein